MSVTLRLSELDRQGRRETYTNTHPLLQYLEPTQVPVVSEKRKEPDDFDRTRQAVTEQVSQVCH